MTQTEQNGNKCSVDGCPRLKKARGLCGMHWQRWRKHGVDGLANTPTTLDRLASLTSQQSEDCIHWDGYADKRGYGRVWFGGRYQLAHRVSYAVNTGTIPAGLCILHQCDNPICVNPAHLSVGTQSENMRDCCVKGRTAAGERNPHAKLSEVDVLAIRGSTGSTRKIAAQFGIASSGVSQIKTHKLWRHI